MNIKLGHYRIFYYAGKYCSIPQAAEELSISQPAGSQALKQLEQGYAPSDAALAAKKNADTLAGQKPKDYQSGFTAQLEALYQEISSRPGFS